LIAVEHKCLVRHHRDNHHFGSLLMLAVTADSFLLVPWIATKSLFVFLEEASIR
jgi:hypothetical protein